MSKFDELTHKVGEARRQYLTTPQRCEIRMPRAALLGLMAEQYPNLNLFELDQMADTFDTLFGARLVIDDTAEDIAVTVSSPLTPGHVETQRKPTP